MATTSPLLVGWPPVIFLLLSWGVHRGPAETVLFFPVPTRSYVIYHSRVAGALADLGHDVHICLTEFIAKEGLVTNDKVRVLTYGPGIGNIEERIESITSMIDTFWKGRSLGVSSVFGLAGYLSQFAQQAMSDRNFTDTYRRLGPDLFVLDSTTVVLNMVILPYSMGTPFALIGTVHDMVLTRTPFSPAAEPLVYTGYTNKMTFLQRVSAAILYAASTAFDPVTDDGLVARFAPHKPPLSVRDILRGAEVFIAETDHILDYPRTTLANTKLVGGSSVSQPKPLDRKFGEFVERSPQGVAVATFGGNDLKVPAEIVDKMVSAFQELDLGVVWRMNTSSTAPRNIMAAAWVPQNDLLGHPNTKVFISHCGKNGQYEALYHGVPILCLPMYGDQWYNARRGSAKGFGLYADIREVAAGELAGLIRQVAYDPKYRANIQRASKLFRELYKVPSKEAAYWLDHVMKYGGGYMRSSGQEMPLYQFLMLDVIAFISAAVAVAALSICVITRRCLEFVNSRGRSKID